MRAQFDELKLSKINYFGNKLLDEFCRVIDGLEYNIEE